MKAKEFYEVRIGSKVVASIGGKRHVAKILEKGVCSPPPAGQRKLFLLFILDDREHREWRAAGKCQPADGRLALGLATHF